MVTSYITPAEAVALLGELLYKEVFASATAQEQQQALNSATVAINNLDFIGDKTDVVQDNEFPRDTALTIPLPIQLATALEANELLDGKDNETEWENEFMSSQNYAGVASQYNSNNKENTIVGILSVEAFRQLKPYLSDFRQIGIET